MADFCGNCNGRLICLSGGVAALNGQIDLYCRTCKVTVKRPVKTLKEALLRV